MSPCSALNCQSCASFFRTGRSCLHPQVALVLSCIWRQMPADACHPHSWRKFGSKGKSDLQRVCWLSCACADQLRLGSVIMHAACPSLQAASVQQPDECTSAAHAVSITARCRGGGQENRGGRVRELEGQLEEVRSHYHHKLRSLENQLQVIACCYMAALPHCLAPHQCQT